jgi:predicted porin
MTPMATYADVRLVGQIGAEVASVSYAGGDESLIRGEGSHDNFALTDTNMVRQTLTHDRYGNILNDGPNEIGFLFDEKIPNSSITAIAAYKAAFNTTTNTGIDTGLQAWAGLKTPNFHFKYGKLRSAYRDLQVSIDPWLYTSLQARGTGGALSGSRYNEVAWEWENNQRRVQRVAYEEPITGESKSDKVGILPGLYDETYGLVHSDDMPGALEIGMKVGPLSARVQGIIDDSSNVSGGVAELKFTSSNITAWLSGIYLDEDVNGTRPALGTPDNSKKAINEWDDNKYFNWKTGVQLKLGTLKLGLQYEDAELGAFDHNPSGGKYIVGSLDYRISNITIAGWVGSYTSDIIEEFKLVDINGETLEEDALSFSVGAKYHFGKRTNIFAGYRQTDSDNDYRDEDVFSAGILHVF